MHLPLLTQLPALLPARRPGRVLRVAVAVASAATVALGGLAAAGAPATAATAPAAKTFTAPIEAWPTPWTSEKGCDGTVKPGPGKLSTLIAGTWGTFGGFGTDRTCHATSEDGHDDYRAVDWMATSKDATQKAAAESFITWLTSADAQGNPAAMARRLGVMYVIWNNRMWRSYPHNGNPAGSWETYLSCGGSSWATSTYDTTCHRNHVHVSLTPDGAWARTSYWATSTTLSSGPSGGSTGPQNTCTPVAGGTLCRHWGADRVETSIAASRDAFPTADSARVAVLAGSAVFADALSGTPLARAEGGPVLLNGAAGLDARVKAELERLLPPGATVYLLGGTGALSDTVRDQVRADGFTARRLAGADRYATALAVAGAVGGVDRIALATGSTFPDALAAGNAMAKDSGPDAATHGVVLLTNGGTLPAGVRTYLAAHPSAALYAIGGPAAQAAKAAGRTPTATVVGTDAYATAAEVAAAFYGSGSPQVAGLVNGDVFADAVAGGLHAALAGAPLLLTPATSLSASAQSFLAAHAASLSRLEVYGGSSVLSDAVAASAAAQMG
jgi:putative cell wall-binding protein